MRFRINPVPFPFLIIVMMQKSKYCEVKRKKNTKYQVSTLKKKKKKNPFLFPFSAFNRSTYFSSFFFLYMSSCVLKGSVMTWNVVSLLFVFYVVTLNNRTLNRCRVTKSNNRKSPCFFFFNKYGRSNG